MSAIEKTTVKNLPPVAGKLKKLHVAGRLREKDGEGRRASPRLKLLIGVVASGDAAEVVELCNSFGAALSYSIEASGTARTAVLDYLGIVLDGEHAQALSLRLNLLVTDGGETYRYLLELRCGTLLVYHGGRDDAARTLTVTKDVLAALVHKQLDTVQGQIPDADMELLRGIETYVTDLDHQPPFHVVEP